MEIIWHGHSFFEIQGKTAQGKIVVAVDPFDKKIGLKPKRTKAHILLLTHYHYDHSNKEVVTGIPSKDRKDLFLIDEPGEYEVKGVKIRGIPSFHDKVQGKERGENTIFVIEIEGIKVCHMGDFGEAELSNEQAKEIVGVDVLLIPVGGKFTISGKEAARIVSQIEPKIVVPMHYKTKETNLDIDNENSFLNFIGLKEKEKIQKLKIQKNEIERQEGTQVIVMKIS
jgi:L-ascorbate metabolism protein UlaG (beta-lactamase superfamily)